MKKTVETELCKIAAKWKTDKAPSIFHTYTPYYYDLLKDRKVKKILEIGIGHPMTMQHVKDYPIGASLYMWQEYFPDAEIYALDIHDFTLINEGHIKSFQCDQGDIDQLREVTSKLGKDFDLIIDDGSHQAAHQILTANALVSLLSPTGLYVIEDVLEPQIVAPQLQYQHEIINCGRKDINDDRLIVIDMKKQDGKPIKPYARPVSIVVLTKYKDVVTPFIESVNKFAPNADIIYVVDKGDIEPKILMGHSSRIVRGPDKFAMAGNGNLGLRAVPNDHDILYCGDDVRFLEPDTIERLQEIAYKQANVGILSPRIFGRSSPAQADPKSECDFIAPMSMWFPCVYIKRELIDKIGYLDERFNDFGCDDFDFCVRALQNGYKLAVTDRVTVHHEASPEGGPTTFVKNVGVKNWREQEAKAQQKFCDKYNIDFPTFRVLATTGDITVLPSMAPKEVVGAQLEPTFVVGPDAPKEKIAAYLRTRGIYIATPAYGGWLSVNYVNSLMATMNLCTNLGIPFSTAFLYNESLITRARNKMVSDYLHKSEFSDFFFIDADIGFDPNDIVSLLLHPEEVIAVACPRKNLRLDRVFQAGKEAAKANGHATQFSLTDMHKMCGEFVLNFPPEAQPSSINLGRLLEVKDAGTGIMRIQRPVFKKMQEAYPDRWYLPMSGEDSEARLPMFMYFQACIDQETAKNNPGGYPDYISEDYSFCRDARKAGMKIHVAPWIKSTHMGSYMFQGDMEMVSKMRGGLR